MRQIEANLGDIFYTFKAKRQSISADMLLDYVTNKRDWTTDIPNLLGTKSRRDELENGVRSGRHKFHFELKISHLLP